MTSNDYLRAYGIDPATVSATEWDEDGYLRFPGGWGRKGRLGDWTPWPEGFNVESFAYLYDQRGKNDERR